MSLSGTLQVGKTALAVTQAAIQTHGNNIANAGDPNYSRQRVGISATAGRQIGGGVIIGTGVSLDGVDRQIDDALIRRLNSTTSDGEAAGAKLQWLKGVESTFNELGDSDLSTAFGEFFNSWSTLANNPGDVTLRRNVLVAGEQVAGRFNDLARNLSTLRSDTADQLSGHVNQADSLVNQIAQMNVQVVQAEGAGINGSANALRDRRDGLVKELATLVNVHTLEQPDGNLNVYAGSAPLVLSGTAIGMELKQSVDAESGRTVYTPVFKDGGPPVLARAGKLGGTMQARTVIDETVDRIDALADTLKFELNRIHSSGQGVRGHASVTADIAVDDQTVALDTLAAGLSPTPANGSFVIHLRNASTGRVQSTLINVPLDGTAGGTSLDDLAASITAVNGVTATITNGRLNVSADATGSEVVFGEDTSGALAALGIGSFFTGEGAGGIAVSATLKADPLKLAASSDTTPGNNAAAVAIARLNETGISSLNGLTLSQAYEGTVFEVASQIRSAQTDAEAAGSVSETLQAQREALSGVSLDEEAVALMRYQRSYQGAARLIAAVDEMMQTILQLV